MFMQNLLEIKQPGLLGMTNLESKGSAIIFGDQIIWFLEHNSMALLVQQVTTIL